MKKLELKAFGVYEMSASEMKTRNGGEAIITTAVVIALIGLIPVFLGFIENMYKEYNRAQEAKH